MLSPKKKKKQFLNFSICRDNHFNYHKDKLRTRLDLKSLLHTPKVLNQLKFYLK